MLKFNYNDFPRILKAIKVVLIIYIAVLIMIFIADPSLKGIILLTTIPIIVLIYYAYSKSIGSFNATFDSYFADKKLEDVIRRLNPDEMAIYSLGLFSYLTMKIMDYYVLIRSPSLFYVCRGVEDDLRLVDKINFAIGRVARKTKLIRCFESKDMFYRISEGDVVFPSPRSRKKVIRGYGLKVFRYKPYYHPWDDLDSTIRSLFAMVSRL